MCWVCSVLSVRCVECTVAEFSVLSASAITSFYKLWLEKPGWCWLCGVFWRFYLTGAYQCLSFLDAGMGPYKDTCLVPRSITTATRELTLVQYLYPWIIGASLFHCFANAISQKLQHILGNAAEINYHQRERGCGECVILRSCSCLVSAQSRHILVDTNLPLQMKPMVPMAMYTQSKEK